MPSPKIRLLSHICSTGMLPGTMTTLDTASHRKSGEPHHKTGWSPLPRQPWAQTSATYLPRDQVCSILFPSGIDLACTGLPAGWLSNQAVLILGLCIVLATTPIFQGRLSRYLNPFAGSRSPERPAAPSGEREASQEKAESCSSLGEEGPKAAQKRPGTYLLANKLLHNARHACSSLPACSVFGLGRAASCTLVIIELTAAIEMHSGVSCRWGSEGQGEEPRGLA